MDEQARRDFSMTSPPAVLYSRARSIPLGCMCWGVTHTRKGTAGVSPGLCWRRGARVAPRLSRHLPVALGRFLPTGSVWALVVLTLMFIFQGFFLAALMAHGSFWGVPMMAQW